MGFSIELFLGDLERIIRNIDIGDMERLDLLEITIQNGLDYAKECGIISK